jgi:hypothetical protein
VLPIDPGHVGPGIHLGGLHRVVIADDVAVAVDDEVLLEKFPLVRC